jgi:para-aminobenzoate synthetase component 1
MKEKVLNWSQQFSTFCFLDNHQYPGKSHSVECLLAAGEKRRISSDAGSALQQLQSFIDEKKCWLFGHLGYDLKNEIEQLGSANESAMAFPDLFFFEPEVVIRLNKSEMIVEAENPAKIFEQISASSENSKGIYPLSKVETKSRITRDEYVSTIEKLKQHILRGDCYEINFCQEFFAEDVLIEPVSVYKKLSSISPNPFSALYKTDGQWLVCASPERYLNKQGMQIISQPIKGTSVRIKENEEADRKSKTELELSAKDRSENVMVVDLVRNDLAKVCDEGTVRVDELFGVYSFPQVHQMISTITGHVKKSVSFSEIIKATFPMGSMTGAPKKRVMELIDEYEKTKRGIFSGALGYINPAGDFDFNVVIRSILYNESAKYLSLLAGSGITFYSDPEKEWEECILKAEAMKKVLE